MGQVSKGGSIASFDALIKPGSSGATTLVAPADDRLEREADRAADHVEVGLPASVSGKASCCSSCATGGGCSGTRAEAQRGGAALPQATRTKMEQRFQYDFSQVRVHTDEAAAHSARQFGAAAFTSGWDVALPARALSDSNERFVAHELAHVVQQTRGTPAGDGAGTRLVQRQLSPPPAEVGGHQIVPLSAPGVKVCARETPIVPLLTPSHAFIDAPSRRYGLMKHCVRTGRAGPGIPIVSGLDLGMPLNPTAAESTSQSPDPCNATPTCVRCVPRPGVANVDACLANAFNSYPRHSEYVVAPGPNSNTFAGTLARRCCQNMDAAPPIGTVPGWGMSPARAVEATCPPGPTQCHDRPAPPGVRADRSIMGGLLLGLAGAAGGALAGAGLGATVGGLVGLLGGPFGAAAGAGAGAIIGGILGGVIGLAGGIYAGLFK